MSESPLVRYRRSSPRSPIRLDATSGLTTRAPPSTGPHHECEPADDNAAISVSRTTRSSSNPNRPRPLYDQKVHPMDKINQRWRWDRYLDRQGLLPSPGSRRNKKREVVHFDTTDDNEDGTISSLNLSDDESRGEEDTSTMSEEGGPTFIKSQSPRKKKEDGAGKVRTYFLTGHALDPQATRHSARLRAQAVLRPTYNARVHPNDADIPHYRGLARKREWEEEKHAKAELREQKKCGKNKQNVETPKDKTREKSTCQSRRQAMKIFSDEGNDEGITGSDQPQSSVEYRGVNNGDGHAEPVVSLGRPEVNESTRLLHLEYGEAFTEH